MNAPTRVDEFHGPEISAQIIAEYVREHRNGVDAAALREHFQRQGFNAAQVQRALRSALDRGYVRLGDALQMVA